MKGPANRLSNDDEKIISLFVGSRKYFQKDVAINTGPKRVVGMIQLQLELGEIPLLGIPLHYS